MKEGFQYGEPAKERLSMPEQYPLLFRPKRLHQAYGIRGEHPSFVAFESAIAAYDKGFKTQANDNVWIDLSAGLPGTGKSEMMDEKTRFLQIQRPDIPFATLEFVADGVQRARRTGKINPPDKPVPQLGLDDLARGSEEFLNSIEEAKQKLLDDHGGGLILLHATLFLTGGVSAFEQIKDKSFVTVLHGDRDLHDEVLIERNNSKYKDAQGVLGAEPYIMNLYWDHFLKLVRAQSPTGQIAGWVDRHPDIRDTKKYVKKRLKEERKAVAKVFNIHFGKELGVVPERIAIVLNKRSKKVKRLIQERAA